MGKEARTRVADFWDAAIQGWLQLDEMLTRELLDWRNSYSGSGHGALQLQYYPDPFVGDLRGVRKEPRLIVLGLNPGPAYPDLQSWDGIWARRIAEESYSRCFRRSHAEDPETWRQRHGRESRYWGNLTRFLQRWLSDPTATHQDILNMELYPWHSAKLSAPIKVPASIIDKFVLQPLSEISVKEIFAFGADWFRHVTTLPSLREVRVFRPRELHLADSDKHGWRLAVYELPSKQHLILSAQTGYAGPPGTDRTKRMREYINAL